MNIQENNQSRLPLTKENYILLAIGFAIILAGFFLMMGGRSDDPAVFNPEIFSFRRITLAPMVVLFGFIFEIYAIMKKPKQK
jgi:predicted cobalt transporter CbtA